MNGIEKLQLDHAQRLYILDLGLKKCFYENFINIAKVHEETLRGPGDIKIFRTGRRMYMYTLPPFMDAVLSEERQLMKKLGIFQVGVFWVAIFQGGEFDWWGFSLGREGGS